jgi:uncharacterized protein
MRMTEQLDVRHDENDHKYYALVDGRESVVQYHPAGEGILNFWHTFVPPEQRGTGIAEELVKQALEDVLRRGYRVIPSCWYVRVYIDRHPRFREALAG